MTNTDQFTHLWQRNNSAIGIFAVTNKLKRLPIFVSSYRLIWIRMPTIMQPNNYQILLKRFLCIRHINFPAFVNSGSSLQGSTSSCICWKSGWRCHTRGSSWSSSANTDRHCVRQWRTSWLSHFCHFLHSVLSKLRCTHDGNMQSLIKVSFNKTSAATDSIAKTHRWLDWHSYNMVRVCKRHWYSLLCADVPLRNYSLTHP